MSADDPWGGPVDLEADDAEFWSDQRAHATDGSHHGRHRDPWFAETRAAANRVPCRDCLRGVGNTCVQVGIFPLRELKHFPAHTRRIKDAGLAT